MERTFKKLPRSIIEQDRNIHLSYRSEDLFVFLLGQKYRGMNECKIRKDVWKRIIRDCLIRITEIINEYVETDPHHLSAIFSRIQSIQDCLKSKEEAYPEIIILNFMLMMELIGGFRQEYIGKNKFKTVPNRKIEFRISTCQKARILCNASYYLGLKYELVNKKYEEMKSKPKEFINWFKTNHPKEYAKIF